ncbi:amine oxidase [Chloropicon primus]|uniref:Amine oxidase n=1 Tax=Chloropicon primus TaxID=1764295 RepID=A0A5B8MYX2_9CHLO|nr:amine oxidase [Chloropicon primus]UPR03915.1 amine oxidase [Chloropicon primus]|eukprot:QDZ24710.1 amine oxidase [Chloropicon primus]
MGSGRQRPRSLSLVVARSGSAAVDTDVVIVGGGISGLACAVELEREGVEYALVEAQDEVGGRVRTDYVDGYTLDRGFQIFLTAYPKAVELLDFEELKLREFYAGASVRYGGEFHRVADPLRHPVDGVLSLANPIGSVRDKVLVGLYRLQAYLKPLEAIFAGEETSIARHLEDVGFSDRIIKTFFRPFLGGIFFDRELGTTSRLFEFVMKMLATGSNCLPEGGIGEVSRQLAGRLGEGRVHLGRRVTEVRRGEGDGGCLEVVCEGGDVLRGKRVVLATEAPAARRIRVMGEEMATRVTLEEGGVGTVCLYFWTDRSPPRGFGEPMLYLNGGDGGVVNNCCFPSCVSPSYAPEGRTLVSVSLVGDWEEGDEELGRRVRGELAEWFGEDFVGSWRLLRGYRIPYAQPRQGGLGGRRMDLGGGGVVEVAKGEVWACGDYLGGATLEGAMRSGVRAAREINNVVLKG